MSACPIVANFPVLVRLSLATPMLTESRVRLPLKVFICCMPCLAGAVLQAAAPKKPLTAAENFEKHCVDCHGADGKAQTRLGRKSGAKDLTDKKAMGKLTDEEVFKTIKFGRKNSKGEEKMEAFGDGLSDPEISELVAYVRGLSK
jgi:mono/diheme cytochrome c family protein